MGYNFRSEKTDKNGRKRIEAICDNCGGVSFVRRDWVTRKYKKHGIQSKHHCGSCSGKINIQKAREKKMDNEMVTQFVTLCEEIFTNLYDEKTVSFIAHRLEIKSSVLIADARDFVHQYLYEGVSSDVYECVEHIENGNDEIVNLYPIEVEMKSRAVIALEQLPRPEGI